MIYKLWDKKTPINGVEASYFLNKEPFKNYNGDIILIFAENGNVSNVESKEVLATIYNIDVNLPLEEFMKAYEEVLNTETEEMINSINENELN